jgi:hypothetical protein
MTGISRSAACLDAAESLSGAVADYAEVRLESLEQPTTGREERGRRCRQPRLLNAEFQVGQILPAFRHFKFGRVGANIHTNSFYFARV